MMNRAFLTVVAVLLVLPAFAGAAPITIPNAGFEARATFDPFAEGVDKYHQWAKEDWRQFEIESNGGPIRIWNPGPVGAAKQGIANVGFAGNAPEGDYVMVVRSRYNDDRPLSLPRVRDFEAITQILTETFDPTMTYTLTAKVGRLPEGPDAGGSYDYLWDKGLDGIGGTEDDGGPILGWYGYALQLAVGGTNVGGAMYAGRVDGGTVIATDLDSMAVPMNTFVTATLTYTPDPANAGLAGQPLQIRLCALENPLDHSLTGWVAFDDVTLTAVPEPMSLTLLGLGGLGLIRRKRK